MGITWDFHVNANEDRRHACFSADRVYRYMLDVQWSSDEGGILWLMLNPSTADAFKNDPTVARCEKRTRQAGYGRMLVANIFALRSTDPRQLYDAEDPVGPANDEAILAFAGQADQIVCGWGNHGCHLSRGREVLDLLVHAGHEPHALKVTRRKQPGHPLYIGYSVTPQPVGVL